MVKFFEKDDILKGGHLNTNRYDFYGQDTEDLNYVVHSGTAQSATSNTITLATTASSTTNAYQGMGIRTTSGTGADQDHLRIVSSNGSTKVAILNGNWITTPDSTTGYDIVDRGY